MTPAKGNQERISKEESAVAKDEARRPKAPQTERSARQREAKEIDLRVRRRVKALGRQAGLGVTLIALITALFESAGFAIALARPGAPAEGYAALAAAAVAAGLVTTLILPRLLPMDPLIMALTNFLCGTGMVVLLTVSSERGARQIGLYLAGLAFMACMSLLVSRLRRYRLLSLMAIVLGVVLLLLPLVFGEWVNGAKNWVTLPGFGSFQPSEMVKLCLIFVLARYFSAHRTVVQMLPALFFAAACMLLLMLQRDLGTALIYYLTTLILFYAASGNLPLTALGLGGGAGAAMLGYEMFSHVRVRVAMWRNPWIDPTGSGYQIIQALLAIGSGGLFGVGLGQGTPEKIPEYHNDFIFAVICEQLGQVFGILIIAVYAALILRETTLVLRARRSFAMLLGCGVISALGIQTFMIAAGVIKLIPLTGVTMPFLSYGGSSLISCLGMIGVLHGTAAGARRAMEEDLVGTYEAKGARA